MKGGTAAGNDHNINIDRLKAGKDTISKTLVSCTPNTYKRDVHSQCGRTLR